MKPVNPEDAEQERKIVRYQRGRFLGKVSSENTLSNKLFFRAASQSAMRSGASSL